MDARKPLSLTKQIMRIARRNNVLGALKRLCPQYPEHVVRRVYWRVVEAQPS